MGTDFITEWNIFDSIIYKVENIASKIVSGIKESKDEIPDPEEMITAATAQLQQENNELKAIRIPGKLVKQGEHYICPDCGRVYSESGMIKDKIRFCSGCGKRIVLPCPSPYINMKHDNNLVNGQTGTNL